MSLVCADHLPFFVAEERTKGIGGGRGEGAGVQFEGMKEVGEGVVGKGGGRKLVEVGCW